MVNAIDLPGARHSPEPNDYGWQQYGSGNRGKYLEECHIGLLPLRHEDYVDPERDRHGEGHRKGEPNPPERKGHGVEDARLLCREPLEEDEHNHHGQQQHRKHDQVSVPHNPVNPVRLPGLASLYRPDLPAKDLSGYGKSLLYRLQGAVVELQLQRPPVLCRPVNESPLKVPEEDEPGNHDEYYEDANANGIGHQVAGERQPCQCRADTVLDRILGRPGGEYLARD